VSTWIGGKGCMREQVDVYMDGFVSTLIPLCLRRWNHLELGRMEGFVFVLYKLC
jgi:hypothetical protein